MNYKNNKKISKIIIQDNYSDNTISNLQNSSSKKHLSKKAKKIILWGTIGVFVTSAVVIGGTLGGLVASNPLTNYKSVQPSSEISEVANNGTVNPYSSLLSTTIINTNNETQSSNYDTSINLDSTIQQNYPSYWSDLQSWTSTWNSLSDTQWLKQ